MIATDVVARGMDFKGVNCVINYDFPDSAAAYVHRIGTCSYINVVLDFRKDIYGIIICIILSWSLLIARLMNYYYYYYLLIENVDFSLGRSGRAGRTGEAITFYTEDDIPFLRNVANLMAASGCEVPSYLMELRKKKWKKHRPKRDSISTKPDL